MTQGAFQAKNTTETRGMVSHHSMSEGQSHPSRTIVHAKLEMTEPGDHDEQEADAVAETIAAGGKISRKISGGSGTSGITVSNQMENQLNHLQGGGHAMPTGLRNMMESGFGQDFSHVRLHTDSEAASLSSSIHAKAFTHGNDIYFNQGQFSPITTEGQKLMAHELTHVVQGGGKVGRDPLPTDDLNLYNYPISKLVTVALVTSPEAGGDAYYINGKFPGYKGLDNDRIRYIYLQEGMSIHEISQTLKDCLGDNEYLQNLLISGHGEWFGILLSTNAQSRSDIDESTERIIVDIRKNESIEFFKTIATLMGKAKEHGFSIQQTIILESCLANSRFQKGYCSENIRDVLSSYVKDVIIYANNAPSYKSCNIYQFQPDGSIKIIGTDETSKNCKSEEGVSTTEPHSSSYYTFSTDSNKFEFHPGDNFYKKSGNLETFSIGIARETANAFTSLLGYEGISRNIYFKVMSDRLNEDRKMLSAIKKRYEKQDEDDDREDIDEGMYDKADQIDDYYRELHIFLCHEMLESNTPIDDITLTLIFRLYELKYLINFYDNQCTQPDDINKKVDEELQLEINKEKTLK